MKIFVDDLNGVFESLPKGTQYVNGNLVIDAKKADEDRNVPDDRATMDVIRDVANDIEDMIVMTVDVPSNHQTARVPMLDVEVWIDEANNKVNKLFIL